MEVGSVGSEYNMSNEKWGCAKSDRKGCKGFGQDDTFTSRS
jgi:hypothetical protein